MPNERIFFRQIQPILDDHVETIYGVEIPLYSKRLKTAGRADLVATYDGIPSVIDFKGSNHLKDEDQISGYFLQTACYAAMVGELYGINIRQTVIVVMVQDEMKPQIFIEPASKWTPEVNRIFVSERAPICR